MNTWAISAVMEMLEMKQNMPIPMKKLLEGSSIDLAQLRKDSELEESQ